MGIEPGRFSHEPDRFGEGFSLFVASGALAGLWYNGKLHLPSGAIAKLFYALIILIGLFGFLWLCLGMTDRYLDT